MEYIITTSKEKVTLPKKGYFSKGDSGISISIISSFLATNFMGYQNKTKVKVNDMLGEYFGKYLETWIKLFQKNNDLEVDGCIGKKTLAKLREYGMDA